MILVIKTLNLKDMNVTYCAFFIQWYKNYLFRQLLCFFLNRQIGQCSFQSGMSSKETRQDESGQASAEYLLTLTVIFTAMVGISVFFSAQVDHFLALLFKLTQSPF